MPNKSFKSNKNLTTKKLNHVFFILALTIILNSICGTLANAARTSAKAPTQPSQQPSLPSQYCPNTSDLTHEGLWWFDKTKSWKCYTQSFSSETKTFIGAQWTGIRVGKIICLYQGTEEYAFPIALEQVHSELVLEPTSTNWSSEIDGYKICKSANVADCPFFVEPPPDLSHIYDQIKYTGKTDVDNDGT